MILKVEDALKLLGRTDPVPKVGILLHILSYLQRGSLFSKMFFLDK